MTQVVKVKNTMGLHARPAAIIARLLQKSRAEVTFTYRNLTVNPRSIMNVLMLAAGENAEILIAVEGEDAEVTLKNLATAFESEFGEGGE